MTPRNHIVRASLAIGLVFLAIASGEIRADVYDLNSANAAFTGGPPYASVQITSPAAGEIKFVITALTSSTDTIGEFAFNTSLSGITANKFTTLPSGWSVSTNSNISTFGRFSFDVGNPSAGTRQHQATIILTGLSSTALADFEVENSKGNLFVVHLFQPSLTGYAGGGTLLSGMPEPSSLAIATVGAVALLGYSVRRRAGRERNCSPR
jgi:hypothetical protein